MPAAASFPVHHRCRGYSLIELMVVVTIAVAAGSLLMRSFVAQSRIARDAMDLVELRQALRIAQMELERSIRMAGRGGLPRHLALSALQNVPPGSKVGAHRIAPETDVLILRGSFEAPIWELRPTDPHNYEALESTARIRVESTTDGGHAQTLDALRELRRDSDGAIATPTRVLLSAGSSPLYAVGALTSLSFEELDEAMSENGLATERATMWLDFATVDDSADGTGFLEGDGFAPAWRPARLTLLDEVRYYVREEAPRAGGVVRLVLSRARMVPCSDVVLRSGAGPGLDIAAGIVDFQVALGTEPESAARSLSNVTEWRFGQPRSEPPLEPVGRLIAVRFSLLGRTARPTSNQLSRPIEWFENRFYDESNGTPEKSMIERRYRRRVQRSVLRLRNS